MSRSRANFVLTLVAIIWGSAFVAQSQGMANMGPMAFTGVRFLVGALVVVPLMGFEWARLQRAATPLRASDVFQVVGLGLLLLMGAAMQQIGITGTTVTSAGFLTALYVPLVPVLGWLIMRQLPHWSVWPGAFACLVGAYLLSGAQGLSFSTGDLWIIGSTIPWALHVLVIGRVADRMGAPFLVACGQFAVCGALALVWALLYEPISWVGLQAAMGPLAYTGVLSVGVAYTAQVVAQRYTHASDAAIVLSTETLFAALFGFYFTGDRLDAAGVVGCCLIFISLMGVQLLPILKRTPAPVLIRVASDDKSS